MEDALALFLNGTMETYSLVLILVVMEDALALTAAAVGLGYLAVLILVVMEDALAHLPKNWEILMDES